MTTRLLVSVLGCAAIAGILFGCKDEAPPSLFSPDYVSGPQPTVTRIDPASSGNPFTDPLAGVTVLTITGTNFSATPANNVVFFDATPLTTLQASTTQLQVKAPLIISDTIKVKIAVTGADLFNTPFIFKLNAASLDKFGNFAPSEEPVAVECDSAGNAYVSMLSSGLGIGVKKFTPAGDRTDYSAVGSWKGMKFGPGGAIFCAAGRAIIFRIPSGGGASAVWVSGSGLTNLSDLDFDQNGNIWAGGPSATNIFRVKQDKTVQAFPFVGTVRAVRVYSGYLYVGGKRDSLEKVWRFSVDATGNLGAEEEYFNLSSVYGANSYGVNALAFSSDGNLYIGTDAAEGIVIVHPNKSSESLYPGVLSGQTISLAWGKNADLFQSRVGTTKTLAKINPQKASAPYYGRTLP
jgi:IPT/TIG domain